MLKNDSDIVLFSNGPQNKNFVDLYRKGLNVTTIALQCNHKRGIYGKNSYVKS